MAEVAKFADRFGLGWRPELAAGIALHLDRIDTLEVIAENAFASLDGRTDREGLAMLADLARQVPVTLHGVGMGLATTAPAATDRIERMARLVERVRPAGWSEHLAFVRSGGIEIGHMAMPPRAPASVAGAIENIARAARVVGAPPAMENIATLVEPPASVLGEGEWTSAIVRAARVPLLLDLHNLYANAVNAGVDPFALLESMPLEAVRSVHLSGGRWIAAPRGGERLLDDHLHDPPDPVYALLTRLGARVSVPLTVVIERDGAYPPIEALMAQLDAARAALARGRARRTAGVTA